ncbi:MAG: flagellar type III secretion system pore protein FliP [Alphaproteobacteria bacterium]|nr:flagellar type III secretion system pore protein FliP [Alphaproteobacteria bacterium]
MTGAAAAQSVSIDLGADGGALTGRVFQLIALLTLLTIAPSLLLMVTSFTRIAVVFSLLRTALGTQGSPPNQVLVGLSLFLTFFVMQPVFERAYNDGIQPLIEERITEREAFDRAAQPFREFMLNHTREQDLMLFAQMARRPIATPNETPLQVLIPAFMLSELKRAFEIGFLLFIPFLVIDMVVSSILMAMGMMMLPPVVISLPFKLIFFVLVDGWNMLAGALVQSYGMQ